LIKYFLAALALQASFLAAGQTGTAVAFSGYLQRTSDTSANLVIKARMPEGLYLFSAEPQSPNDAFISSLTLDCSSGITRINEKITATGNKTSIELDGTYYTVYADSLVFLVPVSVKKPAEGKLPVTIAWLGISNGSFPNGEETLEVDMAPLVNEASEEKKKTAGATQAQKSLGTIFLEGFLAGLGAFIMPCIYAMVPVTVSFFTKRSKTRKQGIKNALLYSASIMGIFTLIGFLITVFLGKGALNDMASSAWFNIGVFVLFMVFGISFLGAFEITLPASWSNRIDARSNINSYSGIFFLALTLVIVSFSCTVPFIGALTVLISKGSFWAPLVGFFAFSLALALPFALFTVFPSLLNNLAKSGGWLNTVKVSLGFIELALALKFLSSADLAYHWGLLDREVYLSLWIVIFGLMGMYLLGKLKFHHDDELPKNEYGLPYLGIPRLFFAIATLSFTVYMIPGLWGAPLNGISAWIPEMKTQDFRLGQMEPRSPAARLANTGALQPKKYTDLLESEIPGVNSFFDFDEALAAARQLNKPLMVDFTGHSCANCRKMEREVLSHPDVMRRLQEDFVVVSLYVDDKFKLPESEWKVSKLDGSLLKRMGEKNLDFEVELTNNNAQPYYVFTNTNGALLTPEGYGYDSNVEKFIAHLEQMKMAFAKQQIP
jgi:thiol:disulfide interchange protein DsbD